MNTSEFIHELKWEHVPDAVRNQVRRCFLDTIGTAVAARQTELSGIAYEFAAAA